MYSLLVCVQFAGASALETTILLFARFFFYRHSSDILDIHDCLDVTVFDEDKDHKSEFLGRVKIPLLRIKNEERR